MSLGAQAHKILSGSAGLLLLIALVIFCVWPGMHAPLFSDDIYQMRKSANFDSWKEIFGPDVFLYYRPAKNALFMLAAPLEKNLLGWHMIGLLSYLAAVIGVFRITSICFESRVTALLATSLWALSPSCVSTSVWLSCANISLGVAFASLVFHFHEKWMTRNSAASLIASGFFYAVSLHCYESMIVIPALLFIRDIQQRRISFNRKAYITYGSYTIIALVFLVIRSQVSAKSIGGSAINLGFEDGLRPIQLSLSAPWFLWRHFLMWIYPFNTLEILGGYSWLRSAPASSLAFGWFFLVALLTSAFATRKRYPLVCYGILFFFVASIPSGNFIPCFNGPIYDVYLTLPSIGLAILCAAACESMFHARSKLQSQRKAGSNILTAILCIFLLYRMPLCGAYFRYWANVWSRPAEMMLIITESRPFQYQPKAIASLLLFSDGYIDLAETLAKQVIDEDPMNAMGRLSLARIAKQKNDDKTAESYYRSILSRSNTLSNIRNSSMVELGTILAADPSRAAEAIDLLRVYLRNRVNVNNIAAIMKLSNLYEISGSFEMAKATLERGLAYNPNEKQLKSKLAELTKKNTDPQQLPPEPP